MSMKKKRIASIILALTLMLTIPVFTAQAEDNAPAVPSFLQASGEGLYAHAVAGASDTEAWTIWQSAEDKDGNSDDLFVKYFFLPVSADKTKAEIYNAYEETVVINDTTLQQGESAEISYTADTPYNVKVGSTDYSLVFKNSTAEAAIYANNPNADGSGTPLFDYLKEDKSLSAKANGAIVDSSGNIDNTAIKKIKGRGNTTWDKAKKPFNITYNSAVSIAGMEKRKKFSLLANYQDASLARNRILYDLSDAVGMPYASDSRFVDFYMNGVYYGSYQCAEKIEIGKNDLINDISDTDYIAEDGSLASNFSFCIEIDPSYAQDDYHTSSSSNEITIKSPELTSDKQYYSEVKDKIKSKFTGLFAKLGSSSATYETLSETIDVDSFAKIYLINELGKNWDSGVSSFYMVYKQSTDGKWRFYASPVWDYDNTLGNCAGIAKDLSNMGVSDYTEYSGWWCKFKGKRARETSSNNIMNKCANNSVIVKQAAKLWFKKFVPEITEFASGTGTSGELYSADGYYQLLKGTADMNYTRGWLLNTGSWISDHSSLKKAEFKNGKYTVANNETAYAADFEGEYNYMVDWMTSRAAWLSNEFGKIFNIVNGDVNLDEKLNINDATEIQCALAGNVPPDYHPEYADFNKSDKVDINDVTAIQIYIAGKQ
ncbi:MAG: CotH kinase family protein [Ruminococcus sp.]|nr:CotH kinase family protein [Ruminococcus sp.]